ncbi:hypothetical protein IMCC3317_23100 [Kordia antarctica]|uniref:HEXXH motif domain-containing protein n=1 Tax=Kordia antarctica TaxID=1218801 RepID=A0A7L4ZK88_9FLAO|nr:hypothetical protein [Kordia antarctica]QHI36940.1 hypothetical protein IMCC3317_23100 [Kordia antarctica]
MELQRKNIDITIAKKALEFSTSNFLEYNKVVDAEFSVLVDTNMKKLVAAYPILKKTFDNLPKEQQNELMFAPEMLRLLFYPDGILGDEKLEHFLGMVIEAQNAKITAKFDHKKYGRSIWTANGSFMISFDEKTNTFSTFHQSCLSNTEITQDYFSHFNLMNSADENHFSEEVVPSLYSFEEADVLELKIDETYDKLETSFQDFVRLFTNVLLLKKTNIDSFKSVTDNTHINRVIICNGHSVELEILAEAFMHEATHGLLTIIDIFNQWQPGNEETTILGRTIRSPWTGNLLTIKNLVQAVYVWYGLYNFWGTKPANFDLKYAEDRVEFIAEGFKKLDMEPYRNILSTLTFSEIGSIKNNFQ